MHERPDAEVVTLHALRCCGTVSAERLGALIDTVTPGEAEDMLLGLAVRGLVTHGGGVFGGWQLTTAGRRADARWIAEELERADAGAGVRAAYHDFLELNQRALDICSAWQVRSFQPMVLNDHTDRVYDAGVLRRLRAVDAQAQSVCARLAAQLPRFSRYGPRLASALDRASSGELDQVTDSVDSYHTVWFQLHEDLLVTLGIERERPAQ